MTKETLRCNVIVSEIVRLEIETTTRLLYLEDSPEELIARGYDSEGWNIIYIVWVVMKKLRSVAY